MFNWVLEQLGVAKQGAQLLDSTTPDPAEAASTDSPTHHTSTASSPGPRLGSLNAHTGDAYTSISGPGVDAVATQYRTTHNLQASLYPSHLNSLTTDDLHLLSSSTATQRYQPSVPSTETRFSSASVPSLFQNRSSPGPAFQFEGTNMNAGRDIGSKNILQQGERNEIHIHSTGATDEHELLLRRIEKKLGSYVASDAMLSKDVHGDPSVCYQGTRERLLRHVLSWVEGGPAETNEDVDDAASRALCIVGPPGSGKTTIMNTLILSLLRDATRRSPGLIAAHYCIRRSLQSTTDSSKVLPTLILQLARRDLGIAKRMSSLLGEALHTEVFTIQLQEEVFLKAISAYNQVVFVIIDALDEASKAASLAATLSRVIPISPPNLRLLLSTRNEHGILQSLGTALIPKIAYNIPTEESVGEVGNYITRRLIGGLRELFGSDPSWRCWPDASQLRSLSDKASGLYIWARTAVDFILSRVEKQGEINRDHLIEEVGRAGMTDVNMLYLFILRRSLQDDADDNNETAMQGIRGVLGFITVAESPLPLEEIVGFLGCKDFDVRNFVRLNRSILVPGTEDIAGSTIPRFHKTFADFITSDRAEEFQIKVEDVHRSMASRCFELMDSQLRFNFCGLCSSFSTTKKLDALVASVPRDLIYASTSWSYHLTSIQRNSGSQLVHPSYLPSIKTLLYETFLFWLEIVSLSKKAKESVKWLKDLADRLEDNKPLTDVDEWGLLFYAKDASFLIERFSECIGASIPHIYLSLLSFSSRDSVLANHYRKRTDTTVVPYPPGMPLQWASWDADSRMAASSWVHSVSFSPCGRRLAAGYESNSVRVWDVETGECSMGPLRGHSGRFWSVSFSRDGLLIASGSDDGLIWVWNTETGKCALDPLAGHKARVWSVSFSPDSARIASSSQDDTVRVWDVGTGDCVLGPLVGHSGEVGTVSYSPDGSCIASGSYDRTIRLWNAQTGECIRRPLTGHREWISSLAFHPDGHRLVSASNDKALRIWDLQKGTCTHGPLTGHTDHVWSVCFSPDGRYIASSSADLTIRIWDARTAVCVAGPFGGTSRAVSSASFSPDGKYLAAGSMDGTVRLWDFNSLLSAGIRIPARQNKAYTRTEITDHTVVNGDGWTLGPQGELLFWAPEPFRSAIWRPSTVRILGRPSMIKPDLNSLVTGEEWLTYSPSS